MALKKSEVTRPVRRKETVQVDALGGEVIVQALLMRDRLELASMDGPKYGHVSEILARSVVDADGLSVYTAEEWEIFGTEHQQEAFQLLEVSQKLSGMGAPEKKESTPS